MLEWQSSREIVHQQSTQVGAVNGSRIGLARCDVGRIHVAPDWGEWRRPLTGGARSSVIGREHHGLGCYGPSLVSRFDPVRTR
jgi:hypothetical protein